MLTGEDGTLAKFQLGDSVYQWSAFFSKECREICRADTRAEDTFANTVCSSLVYPLFNMDSIHQSKERWAPYLSATHLFCSPLLLILLTSINTFFFPGLWDMATSSILGTELAPETTITKYIFPPSVLCSCVSSYFSWSRAKLWNRKRENFNRK